MKNFILLFVLLPFIAATQSNVGVGTTTPDASAKMEVSSTTQGLLIPRMTEAQRNAVNSPATSLTIYQTDNGSGFYFYDGTIWKMIGDDLGSHLASQIVDMDTNRIVNLSAPINGLDAVNKDYVDAAITSGGGGGSLGSGMPTEVSNESTATFNFGSALVYCDTLTEGGDTDWILPSSLQFTYAAGGGCVIPGTRTGNLLWTRTSMLGGQPSDFLVIRLSDGYTVDGYSLSTYRCRCVR